MKFEINIPNPFRKKAEKVLPQKRAYYDYSGYAGNVFSVSYDGEKNHGEVGPIKSYYIDHVGLSHRAWQQYLESDICQTGIKRLTAWVVGSGLKLQAQPIKPVLESEKISVDVEQFNKAVEARFSVWAKSKLADYSNMVNLHKIAWRAYFNAMNGGDVLVVLRVVKGNVTVQLIDGVHICSPSNVTLKDGVPMYNGNIIRHGIELSPTGEHLAYHVRTAWNKFERISARGERTGLKMAFLVYGNEYRLDNIRGLPAVAAVIETAKKLERYKEATLGSAEERAKIAYTIEHEVYGTGENPLVERTRRMAGLGTGINDQPRDVDGEAIADKVTATTNKTAINLPIGASVKQLVSDNELYFKDFFQAGAEQFFATIEIPPNVAMSKYDSNYSASRAAIKDWEHTISVKREDFSTQFYTPIYKLWLFVQIHSLKIEAPGYREARAKENMMAIEAYENARWVGANVPHIDPEKEVRSERLKLGDLGANIPLTTIEAATEALNGGDSSSNIQQFAEELKELKKLGIQTNDNNSTTREDRE